jgi:hypothetical protein
METPWQQWKRKNAEKQNTGKVSPVDFINPDTEYASVDEINARYAICEKCPKLLASKQCKECGCFMPLKTKLLHATCPINKW